MDYNIQRIDHGYTTLQMSFPNIIVSHINPQWILKRDSPSLKDFQDNIMSLINCDKIEKNPLQDD